MTTLREAAQQALEALEKTASYDIPPTSQVRSSITALRAALEHVHEPVAWRTFDGEGGYDYRTYDDNENYRDEWDRRNPNHKGWVEPLYKNPTPCETCQALARTVLMDQTGYYMAPRREWVGLTGGEIRLIVRKSVEGVTVSESVLFRAVARAVETALKEKNA
jgi:hypothetical protein